jgi:magnesium transporter
VTRPVRSLVTLAGEVSQPSPEELCALAAEEPGRSYWLDIQDPDQSDYELLLNGYRFHPLTVEDVRVQNQRPKMDEFRGYKFVVLFTASRHRDSFVHQEHHLYLIEGRALVTIHQGPAPPLEALRKRLAEDPSMSRNQQRFVDYLVINALVESLYPVLDELDDRIDTLEDRIVLGERPRSANPLARVTALKHAVTDLRRILAPQRDVFQRLVTHSLDLGGGDDLSLYWRDVYEHLVRQYEQVDSLRDLLTGTLDLYVTDMSNRLNGTVKQLTVIASLFLPLTFLTGFFGMNFGFLVGHITTVQAFEFGVTIMVLTTAVQLAIFRLRGWL